MIPVQLAAEPATFDAKVRRRGDDAMLELTGRIPSKPRRGRPRKVVARRRDQIPSGDFPPYWRDVLPEMRTLYASRCAYLAMYLEPATGSPTVDHVIPRSRNWRLVYEWSNYRLAASLVNSRKNDLETVLDPFTIAPETFALDFTTLEVTAGAVGRQLPVLELATTLSILNAADCCLQRAEYVDAYRAYDISLRWLERRAPFIAQELRRQGKLNPGDT